MRSSEDLDFLDGDETHQWSKKTKAAFAARTIPQPVAHTGTETINLSTSDFPQFEDAKLT